MTWFLATIFAFILIKHAMDTHAAHEQEKLRLLEEALRQGNMDEKSKEDLMESLTGRRPSSPPTPPPAVPQRPRGPNEVGFFLKFLAFIGWLSLCTGIAFLILWANFNTRSLEIPAVLLTCIGFGLVTFPFVIRELQFKPRPRNTDTDTDPEHQHQQRQEHQRV